MKSILTLAALAVFAATPAFAADQDGNRTSITKGSKSYQSGRNWGQDQQAPSNAPDQTDPANIEPAAGGDAPSEAAAQPDAEVKSFREEMRLPRKN